MSVEENKALIQRYFEEFNQGKTDNLNEFITDAYVYRGPGGHEINGIDGLKKFMTWLNSSFPAKHLTIDDLIAEGDKMVTFWTMKGADKRNKQFSFQGVIASHLKDGKVVEDCEIFDRFAIASQLAPGWAKVLLNFIDKQSVKDRP
jgi:predicted ester cyclase